MHTIIPFQRLIHCFENLILSKTIFNDFSSTFKVQLYQMQRSTEDFFGAVYSLIDVSELQGEKLEDTVLGISTSGFLSIEDSNQEHLGHRLLKRKPRKEVLKPLKSIKLGADYTNSFKSKILNDFIQGKDQCLNMNAQLNRLQKTLVSSKSSKKLLSVSRSGRLLKKMVSQKQNLLLGTQKIEVTSEQLHSLHDQDGEIKETLLSLIRFEEQQKLQNDQLELEIQAIASKIDKSKQLLQGQCMHLADLKSRLLKQTLRNRQQQYQILRQKVNDAQNY